MKITIKELCKVCAEYDHNITKMNILKSEVKGNKKHPHLQWAIDRDTKALNKLIDRQTEIIKELSDNVITDNSKVNVNLLKKVEELEAKLKERDLVSGEISEDQKKGYKDGYRDGYGDGYQEGNSDVA